MGPVETKTLSDYTFLPMSLQLSDIDHLMTLSHLSGSQDEKERYLGQLQNILKHMDVLNAVSFDSLPDQAQAEPTLLREDVVLPHQDLTLDTIAPVWENECFRVPKILA